MAVQPAAGSKLYVGTTAAAADQAAFEADTYTEVGEIENIGEFGDQASEVLFTAVGDRRVRKFKGSFNAGTLALTLGRDPANAGQADLAEALASDDDHNFKVVLGGGDTFYFRGKVMSYTTTIASADNVVRATCNIGINSAILEVAAAA